MTILNDVSLKDNNETVTIEKGYGVETFSKGFGKVTFADSRIVIVKFSDNKENDILYFTTHDFLSSKTFHKGDNVWYDNYTRNWCKHRVR